MTSALVDPCLTDLQLAQLMEDGAMDRDALSEHLDRCASCRQLVAALVRDPEVTRVEPSRVQPALDADQQVFTGNDRYDVIGLLGVGGMGVVYEVYDHAREEVVALKSLPTPSAAARARLKSEFRVLRELRHPHVVRLHDLVQSDEGCFFTMERIYGLPLDRALGPLPCVEERRLRRIFRQLAAAVSALHEEGVVHRDLKPSNVLVTAADDVKLVDFGLAVTLSHDDPRARIAGTLAYMAPEQRQGEAPSPATDWFNFGGCLFHCLVGAPPFGPEAPPLAHRDGELVALCRALLALQPTDRLTGAEVLAQLGAGSAVPALPFVGRTEQRARLDDVIEARGAIIVVGAPGIGKTALVRHMLAARCALASRCRPQEHLPFNALDGLVDALETHLSSHADERLDQPLTALAQLFPSIPSEARLASTSPLRLRHRALDELAAQLDRVAAHHELTLFVDDLQWADDDSVEALRELLAKPRRWAFVATARTDADARSLAPELPNTTTIPLGPLSHHEVAELMGDGVDANAAGGHPLWLERMVRHPSAPPERSVEALIGQQLEHLDGTALQVLQVLSMAGLPLTVDRLAATLETTTGAARQALELLLDEQLVRSEPPAQRPRHEPFHDRIRELVHGAMGDVPAELHFALARALVSEPETAATLFACADHANEALRRGVVADPLTFARINRAASRRARGATTLGTAAEYARMGMAWLEHADEQAEALKRELALLEIEVCRLAGEDDAAEAAYRRATRGLTPHERLPFARQRMQLSLLVDGAEPALACGREALDAVGVHVPAPLGYADLAAVMARTTWSLHRHGLPSHTCSDATRESMRLIAELLPVAVFLGDDTLSAWLALRCLDLTLAHGVAPESALGITGRGSAMAILGRYTTARDAHAEATRLLERFDDEAPAMAHIAAAGWLAPWAEPFAVTAAAMAEREKVLERRGDAYGLSMMRTIRLTAHLEAGHCLDGLSALPESVIDLVERHDLRFDELTGFSRLSIATLRRLKEGPDLPAAPALHNPFATFITHLHEGLVRAFWGDIRSAALAFTETRRLVVAARGQPLLARLYCYLPIVGTDIAEDPALSRDAELREVSSPRACLLAAWELTRMARACPENHQPRADLAWAEVGRRLGFARTVVMHRYDRAVAGALAQKNLELEGLARWRRLGFRQNLGQPLDPPEIERMRLAIHRWGSPMRADSLAAALRASTT